MFKLIATIYILMNGQPVGEPVKAVNRTSFASLDECIAFNASETGAASLERLNEQVVASLPPGGTHTVTTGCEAAKDDSI